MATFKQDMPPAGGYGRVTYQKIPFKSINPYLKLAVLAGITTGGWAWYYVCKRQLSHANTEMLCGDIALEPMLRAEADRAILKHLKKNMQLEEEVMKDVPGWEVGKWKGYPVFCSIGENEWIKPLHNEYFIHQSFYEQTRILTARKFL